MIPLSMTLSDLWPHLRSWNFLKTNIVKTARLKDKITIAQYDTICNMWNGTMFVDLDWPLNVSSLLSASAELLVVSRDSELDQNLSGDFQKKFSSNLNEIWYVGRGRWVMHDGMPYGRNHGQGQGHSREVDRQSPTGLIFLLRLGRLPLAVCNSVENL